MFAPLLVNTLLPSSLGPPGLDFTAGSGNRDKGGPTGLILLSTRAARAQLPSTLAGFSDAVVPTPWSPPGQRPRRAVFRRERRVHGSVGEDQHRIFRLEVGSLLHSPDWRHLESPLRRTGRSRRKGPAEPGRDRDPRPGSQPGAGPTLHGNETGGHLVSVPRSRCEPAQPRRKFAVASPAIHLQEIPSGAPFRLAAGVKGNPLPSQAEDQVNSRHICRIRLAHLLSKL